MAAFPRSLVSFQRKPFLNEEKTEMTENMPPMTPEQFRQLNRALMVKVLDKAASDPAWKQRLLDGPEAAMAEAGFPETRQLREMRASVRAEEVEVMGQIDFGRSGNRRCVSGPMCGFFSAYHQDLVTGAWVDV
jgi:hypothetical protein